MKALRFFSVSLISLSLITSSESVFAKKGRTASSVPLSGVEYCDGTPRSTTTATWSTFANTLGLPQARAKFPKILGDGVTIAIVDDGIKFDEPFLMRRGKSKVIGGRNLTGGNRHAYGFTGTDHGTQIAWMIAAEKIVCRGNYFEGLAPNANIISVKIGPPPGTDPKKFTADDATLQEKRALTWLYNNRKFFNLVAVNITEPRSGAIFRKFTVHKKDYEKELKDLYDAGIFVTVPSSNSTDFVHDPDGNHYIATYPQLSEYAFPTSSVDYMGRMVPYVQLRPVERTLLAPASGQPAYWGSKGIGYNKYASTSWTSGIVSGLAVLLKQMKPDLSPRAVWCVMKKTGNPVGLPAIEHPEDIYEMNRDDDFRVSDLTHVRVDKALEMLLPGNRKILKEMCPEAVR